MLFVVVLIFFFFFFLVALNRYSCKAENCFYIIFMFLIVVAVFRDGNALYDYDVYVEAFDNYDTFLIEKSFYFVSYFVHKYLNSDALYLFAFYAIFGLALKFYSIKQLSLLIIPSIFIYFCNFYIAQELIQMRSGVAAGFCLLCIKPVYERNFPRFFFFLLLGCFFHSSAILFLLVWFLNPHNLNKRRFLFLFLISYFFYFIHVDLLSLVRFIPVDFVNSKYSAYEQMDIEKANVFSIAQIIKCLVTFILLLYSDVLAVKNKFSFLILKIMILSLSFLPLLASNAVAGNRIRDLFGIVEILLFPMIIYIFKSLGMGYLVLLLLGSSLFIISVFNLLLF